MTVVIERFDRDDHELTSVARIDSGTITAGKDAIEDLLVGGQIPSEAELLTRFRGPTLFARKVDPNGSDRGDTDDGNGTA